MGRLVCQNPDCFATGSQVFDTGFCSQSCKEIGKMIEDQENYNRVVSDIKQLSDYHLNKLQDSIDTLKKERAKLSSVQAKLQRLHR